jgi:hypothetical protein
MKRRRGKENRKRLQRKEDRSMRIRRREIMTIVGVGKEKEERGNADKESN